MIATLRITSGRENSVIEAITAKVKKHSIPVRSIVYTEELKGYMFLEGEANDIETATKGLPHIRGMINKPIPIEQLEKFLVKEKAEIKVELGDVIEIIGGPFKGEKGKVTRVDDTKSEITVEFLEAAMPIPVTISVNSVRMYEKKRNE